MKRAVRLGTVTFTERQWAVIKRVLATAKPIKLKRTDTHKEPPS